MVIPAFTFSNFFLAIGIGDALGTKMMMMMMMMMMIIIIIIIIIIISV